MLKQKLSKNDVLTLKLTTGEELISRFVDFDNAAYTVNNPMVLVAGPQGLGMQPFMLSVKPDGDFTITQDKILCVMNTEEELAKQFVSQISGILLQ